MIDPIHLHHLNAVLNTISALLIITAYIFIKQGKEHAHKVTMLLALATSTLFLISYLIRHYYVPSVPFEGDGIIKIVYYVILFSHIVLAAMIVPLIIITIIPAFKGNLDKHKKIAKWTVPIWLYVSVTGIFVYILLYRL